jgi:hypothetical protein
LLVIGKKDVLPNSLAHFAHKSMPGLTIRSHHVLRRDAGAIGVWLKLTQGNCRGGASGFGWEAARS